MSEEIQDLVIAARPEGVEEASQQMGELEDDLNETGDAMEDQADNVQGLSRKWKGAFSAMATGLAVAAAGILSTVPIFGEWAAGVSAVAEAIGFQIDQLIRDLGGGGLSEALFKVSEWFYGLEGAAGDLVGALALIVTTVTAVAGAWGAYVGATSGIIAGAQAFVGVFITVGKVLLSVVGAILSVKAAIVIAVAAVVGFAAAYITNFRGTRDKTNKFIGDIVSKIESVANNIKDLATDITDAIAGIATTISDNITNFRGTRDKTNKFIGDIVSKIESGANNIKDLATDITDAIAGIATTISDKITGVVDDASDWGTDIVDNITTGITDGLKKIATEVGKLKDKITDPITGAVSDMTDNGKDIISNIITGILKNLSLLETQARNVKRDIAEPIGGLVDDALDWGENIIDNIIKGIKNNLKDLEKKMKDVSGTIEDYMPANSPSKKGPLTDLDTYGPKLVETFATGIEANTGRLSQASESAAAEADPRTSSRGVSGGGSRDLAVFIDGRRAEKGTANYRDSSVLRRGKPK